MFCQVSLRRNVEQKCVELPRPHYVLCGICRKKERKRGREEEKERKRERIRKKEGKRKKEREEEEERKKGKKKGKKGICQSVSRLSF